MPFNDIELQRIKKLVGGILRGEDSRSSEEARSRSTMRSGGTM